MIELGKKKEELTESKREFNDANFQLNRKTTQLK